MYSKSLSSRGLKASRGYSVKPLFVAMSDRSRPPRYLGRTWDAGGPDTQIAVERLLPVYDPYIKRDIKARQEQELVSMMSEEPGRIALDVRIAADWELFSFPRRALDKGRDLRPEVLRHEAGHAQCPCCL